MICQMSDNLWFFGFLMMTGICFFAAAYVSFFEEKYFDSLKNQNEKKNK